jgi:hypothetical protein
MNEEPLNKLTVLVQKIQESYENKFMTGDGVDLICDVMSTLYACEAKSIAVANVDISADDDFMPSIPVIELFKFVENKDQFIDELDSVFYQVCKAKMDSGEIIDFILSFR